MCGARTKKPPSSFWLKGGFCIEAGDTYSHAFGTTIGPGSLTTVFGMGTGVAFQEWSPASSSVGLANRSLLVFCFGLVVVKRFSWEPAIEPLWTERNG